MTVAAGYSIFVAADQHGQLAVRFETDDAMEYLHACIFHTPRPPDIRCLIEARHEFDDQGGLFGGGGLDHGLEYG